MQGLVSVLREQGEIVVSIIGTIADGQKNVIIVSGESRVTKAFGVGVTKRFLSARFL